MFSKLHLFGMATLAMLGAVDAGSYKERTSGQCGDSSGESKITSAAACGVGAEASGWADTTPVSTSAPDYPPGCFFNGNQESGELLYNDNPTSFGACKSDGSPGPYSCLCASSCRVRLSTTGIEGDAGGGNGACADGVLTNGTSCDVRLKAGYTGNDGMMTRSTYKCFPNGTGFETEANLEATGCDENYYQSQANPTAVCKACDATNGALSAAVFANITTTCTCSNGASGDACDCGTGTYTKTTFDPYEQTCKTCTTIANAAAVTCTTDSDQKIATCDAGYYGSPGNASCQTCGAGFITNTGTTTGATTCTPCAAGLYSVSSNVASCSTCTTIDNAATVTCTTDSNSAAATCADGFNLSDKKCVAAAATPAPAPAKEKTPDEIFLLFDANDSGAIEKNELVLALGVAGVTVTTAQVDTLMSIIDTDNDGKISKAEFLAFVGTSKMLSMEDVVSKMEASFATAKAPSQAATTDASSTLSTCVRTLLVSLFAMAVLC